MESTAGPPDGPGGEAQRWAGTSWLVFSTSVGTSAAFALTAFLAMSCLLTKPPYRRIYAPRGQHSLGSIKLHPHHPLRWWRVLWHTTDIEIANDCGLDAAMFICFLRLLFRLFGLSTCLLLPLLIPLCWYRSPPDGSHVTGMDRLGWSSIGVQDHARHWAFCVAVWMFVGVFTAVVRSDARKAAHVCQRFLRRTKVPSSSGASISYYVLLQNIPQEYRDEALLNIRYRDKWPSTFEKATIKVDKQTFVEHRLQGLWQSLRTIARTVLHAPGAPRRYTQTNDGQNVPANHWAEDAAERQRSAAWLSFSQRADAEDAAAQLHSDSPGTMVPLFIGADISNIKERHIGLPLGLTIAAEMVMYGFASLAVVLWGIPMAWTGMLSQLSSLARLCGWQEGFDAIPDVVVSLIQGLVPTVALYLLRILFPPTLDKIVSWRLPPTYAETEQTLMPFTFVFGSLNSIAMVSMSASIPVLLVEVANSPQRLPTILAQNLPRAGNYFLSYVITQALFDVALTCLQPTLWLRYLQFRREHQQQSPVTNPRMRSVRQSTQSSDTSDLIDLRWSTIFPTMTVQACAAIIYGPLVPLILPLSAISFCLSLMVYRYRILYVGKTVVPTGGPFFGQAINFLWSGIYTVGLCFTGLFILLFAETGSAHCVAQVFSMFLVMGVAYSEQKYHWRFHEPLFQKTAISWPREALSNNGDNVEANKQHPLRHCNLVSASQWKTHGR